MECASEFRQLASRNNFVGNLEKQGYVVDFIGGHLLIYGLPYLNQGGELLYGDVCSPVDLKEGYEIDLPTTHQVWFRGEVPCDLLGQPLRISAVSNVRKITPEFVCPLSFSLKIEGRNYLSFEEKIKTYIEVLTTPAQKKYNAIPQGAVREKAKEGASPLQYPDTLSARDGVNDLAQRLIGVKVAIVGAGGTGSYILDFLSKTHLELIRIYDDDIVHVHTVLRMPGAVPPTALGKKKVEVLFDIYSSFHSAIEPIAEKVDQDNVHSLAGLDFVFIAIDDGSARTFICQKLTEYRVPFIDVGMGLYRAGDSLNGMIRTAGGELSDAVQLIGTEYLPAANPADGEYRRQPQIAELNAFNAALAVMRFKQRVGIFCRDVESVATVFEIGNFELGHYHGHKISS